MIREYEKGNRHLRYEFMTLQDEENYIWMRVDAYIFYSPEDNSIHMFTYRKNINEEKKKEEKAEIDEMTGFYNKKATERLISKKLLKSPTQKYALFIFDIDNFKQANDNYGHLFGDSCIKEFTRVIKESLGEESTIMGRVGGDEFVVFTPIINTEWVDRKAKEVSKALKLNMRIIHLLGICQQVLELLLLQKLEKSLRIFIGMQIQHYIKQRKKGKMDIQFTERHILI